jgi:hypothetical protein
MRYVLFEGISSPRPRKGISEVLWVFIKYQIIFYVPNFAVDILPILTYDVGSRSHGCDILKFLS